MNYSVCLTIELQHLKKNLYFSVIYLESFLLLWSTKTSIMVLQMLTGVCVSNVCVKASVDSDVGLHEDSEDLCFSLRMTLKLKTKIGSFNNHIRHLCKHTGIPSCIDLFSMLTFAVTRFVCTFW